jgi:hypothetical protein
MPNALIRAAREYVERKGLAHFGGSFRLNIEFNEEGRFAGFYIKVYPPVAEPAEVSRGPPALPGEDFPIHRDELDDDESDDGELDDGEPWVPNATQRAVLNALNGKALHAAALARAVGYDRRRLYKYDVLPDLKSRGMVKRHPQLGLYRPDAPPPELRRR